MTAPEKKMTVPEFRKRKGGTPLVVLTAYDVASTLAADYLALRAGGS